MTEFCICGTNGTSKILIGERIQNLACYLPENSKIIVITDCNITKNYSRHFNKYPIIEVGLGEKNKSLDTVHQVYQKLIDLGADRSSFIIGIGGGIVCDVTGFIASTFMRGIPFGFVSTTLLSQVDASIGGKNGVNFLEFKNLVGTFNQPEFVICDLDMLKTLPLDELRVGFSEIIKHSLIGDRQLFDYLKMNTEAALALDTKVIEHLVLESVRIKAAIVNKDEKEQGERMKLNFGHTFGHAIEKHSGLSHGKAISIGMAISLSISLKKGYLQRTEVDEIIQLLEQFGLPVKSPVDYPELLHTIRKDKKKSGEDVHFVLLNSVGSCLVEKISFSCLLSLFL